MRWLLQQRRRLGEALQLGDVIVHLEESVREHHVLRVEVWTEVWTEV